MKYQGQFTMTRAIRTSTHLVKILPVANSLVKALEVRGFAEDVATFFDKKSKRMPNWEEL